MGAFLLVTACLGDWQERQRQVHILGENARTWSDQCHPVSQRLFIPDSLAGPVPGRILLLAWQIVCSPFWDVFRT